MSHVLTEVATYTANVTVPDDGDDLLAASVETPFQAVADRTKYLKEHVDAIEGSNVYGRYAVSGAPALGAEFTLAETAANGLTVGSNAVTITQTGLYLITFCGTVRRNVADDGAGTADGAFVSVDICIGGTPIMGITQRRFVDEVGIAAGLGGSVVASLTAAQLVTLEAAVADLNTMSGVLSVARIA